jgi:medium-chain acyl-[acyl-carrier-protein] hydrolase
MLANHNGRYANGWLVKPKPNPQAALRLFCFPYSGAGASVYYKWAELLPAALEICAVQLPGRETRLTEPLFEHIDPLIVRLADALLPALKPPFAFFGHSMGALISYELSRYLQRRHNIQPQRLLVSGHGAPQLPEREPPIHNLPEPEFVARLRELDGTPEAVLEHAELRALLLPILRADFAICETYAHAPGDLLDCPISAFGGLQDRYVTRANLQAWQKLTRGPLSVRMFPGGHFYLNQNQALLLRAIAQDLLA